MYLVVFNYMYVAHLRTLFLPVALQSVTCCDRLQADHHQKKKGQKKRKRPKKSPPLNVSEIGQVVVYAIVDTCSSLKCDYVLQRSCVSEYTAQIRDTGRDNLLRRT